MIIRKIDLEGKIKVIFDQKFVFNPENDAPKNVTRRYLAGEEVEFSKLTSENTGKDIFALTYQASQRS